MQFLHWMLKYVTRWKKTCTSSNFTRMGAGWNKVDKYNYWQWQQYKVGVYLTWMEEDKLLQAVRKGLDDKCIIRVLRLCCQIVAPFSSCWKHMKELQEVLEQKDYLWKTLCVDVSTRWGSTIFMIKQIREQIDAICIVLSNDRKASHLMPTWQDSDVIDMIIAALDPLDELTDLLSGWLFQPLSHYYNT